MRQVRRRRLLAPLGLLPELPAPGRAGRVRDARRVGRPVIVPGTPEWLEARKGLITATDLPVILGLSPYKCEADLADEKNGKEQDPPTLRMRAGLLLEGLIAEAYTEQTGRKVQ